MKPALFFAIAAATLLAPAELAVAQVAGSKQLGVAEIELKDVVKGWSVKRQVLGQAIHNDKGEEVGKVEDVIISPDRAASYAIVGVGGFLGIGTHDVAIPAGQLKQTEGKLVLPGATKEVLRAMPRFEYAGKW